MIITSADWWREDSGRPGELERTVYHAVSFSHETPL